MKLLGLLLCMLMLAACRPVMPEADIATVPQPIEDAEQVPADQWIGIWTGPAAFQFNEHGAFAIAEMSQQLDSRPLDQGRYTLEGTTLTIVSNDQSYICENEGTGTYTVEMSEDGSAWLHLLADTCGERVTVLPGQYHRK